MVSAEPLGLLHYHEPLCMQACFSSEAATSDDGDKSSAESSDRSTAKPVLARWAFHATQHKTHHKLTLVQGCKLTHLECSFSVAVNRRDHVGPI